MNVVPMRHERGLAHVLIDIAAADKRWRNHWGEEVETELLDNLERLRSEARTMLWQLTGVDWDRLSEANL